MENVFACLHLAWFKHSGTGEVLISVRIFELQMIKLLFGGARALKGKFSEFDGNRLKFVCLFLFQFLINMIHILFEYEKQATTETI